MHRFYIKTDLTNKLFISDKELFNQIIKVFRSKNWDEFIFFNWEDNFDYVYSLKNIWKKDLEFTFCDKIEKKNIKTNVNIYQSLPNKFSKIELILQKWVEVWIKNFTFFKAERSQKLNLSDNKIDRLKKIIIEAVEQSGSNYIPTLNFIDSLPKDISWAFYFHFWEDSTPIKNIPQSDNYTLIIWPEWWFCYEEDTFLKQNNTKISLWNNILRTETSSIVAWFFLINR